MLCGLRRISHGKGGLRPRPGPVPVADFRHVFAVFADPGLVAGDGLAVALAGFVHPVAQARDAADGVEGELVAVHVVEHHHVEGGGGGAFFLVAAHVQVGVVVAAVGEAVDQPRVAVIGEDDGFVAGEQRIEGVIVEAVGVFGGL